MGTHWQPQNTLWVVARQSGPGVGSGEGGDRGAVEVVEVARVVTAWGGGVLRERGSSF